MLTATEVPADDVLRPPRESTTVRLGQAWRHMRRGVGTGALLEQVFGRRGGPDFVEPGHLDVLELLVERDGQRMSDLATALHLDPSTVTRTMHRMEAAGLARRAGAARDGRVVIAHLTTEGRRLQHLVAARRSRVMEAALGTLGPVERVQLVDLLERFVDALAGTAAVTPEPAR